MNALHASILADWTEERGEPLSHWNERSSTVYPAHEVAKLLREESLWCQTYRGTLYGCRNQVGVPWKIQKGGDPTLFWMILPDDAPV